MTNQQLAVLLDEAVEKVQDLAWYIIKLRAKLTKAQKGGSGGRENRISNQTVKPK